MDHWACFPSYRWSRFFEIFRPCSLCSLSLIPTGTWNGFFVINLNAQDLLFQTLKSNFRFCRAFSRCTIVQQFASPTDSFQCRLCSRMTCSGVVNRCTVFLVPSQNMLNYTVVTFFGHKMTASGDSVVATFVFAQNAQVEFWEPYILVASFWSKINRFEWYFIWTEQTLFTS